jgi:hypothetical protein
MPLNPSVVRDQVQLLSTTNTDKIVRVFEGSFDAVADTTVINYTFLGFPNPVRTYVIPHGLPRPVFCELLWSTDGTLYVDGATSGYGGNTTIAFSDSTNVYVPTPIAAGTVFYKVICAWIDDYDTTNPSIQSIMYRDKPFSLDSRLNYPKIYEQDVLNFGATGSQTVLHPLGYSPNAKVFFEALPGQVWPLNFGGTSNPFLYDDNQVEGYMFIERSDLYIKAVFPFSATGSRRFWYRIYYDD